MENLQASRVVTVDRLRDGLIITFDDGKCGFYSNALLRQNLLEADDLTDLKGPNETLEDEDTD